MVMLDILIFQLICCHLWFLNYIAKQICSSIAAKKKLYCIVRIHQRHLLHVARIDNSILGKLKCRLKNVPESTINSLFILDIVTSNCLFILDIVTNN
uniref:Secreted protein n=1 Tax=Arundo donax TaxID=35708 RepID=A0A0A9CZQ7_ARUDO